MIKGIMFDMGGTLLENRNLSFKNVMNCVYKYINHNVFSLEYFESYFESRVVELLKSRKENEYEFLSLLKGLASKFYITEDLEKIEIECNKNLCEYYLINGVVEFLEKIKRDGLKMIVLSNTCFSKKSIEVVLREFGLDKYFSQIVVSSEYGVRKPSEEFYRAGLNKIELKKDEVIMIGNSYEADILGAKRLKIKSILIDEGINSYSELNKEYYLVKYVKDYTELMKYNIIEEIFLEKYISNKALSVASLLKQNGYECYIVGGAIRNALIGKKVNDYDFTTNAMPEVVKEIFEKNDYKVIETGIKHGTVTVIKNKIPYEITTYRQDGSYLDNRHPENVSFNVSLEEDLKRRDFTINAFVYDGDCFIDKFNGLSDLEKGIIRTVGNANKRFEEDALRILRALRFASLLGFKIDDDTKAGIKSQYKLLKNVSIERINDEVLKMLDHKCYRIIDEYKYVFEYVYDYTIDDKYLKFVDSSSLNNAMKFAIFGPKINLHSCELKMPNKYLTLVNLYQNLIYGVIDYNGMDGSLYEFRKFVFNVKKEYINDIITLLYCVFEWNSGKMIRVKNNLDRSINHPYTLEEVKITGFDLMKYGYSGSNIKKIKVDILDAIYRDEIDNSYEAIIDYLNCIKLNNDNVN